MITVEVGSGTTAVLFAEHAAIRMIPAIATDRTWRRYSAP
jgi:hypothetical protein